MDGLDSPELIPKPDISWQAIGNCPDVLMLMAKDKHRANLLPCKIDSSFVGDLSVAEAEDRMFDDFKRLTETFAKYSHDIGMNSECEMITLADQKRTLIAVSTLPSDDLTKTIGTLQSNSHQASPVTSEKPTGSYLKDKLTYRYELHKNDEWKYFNEPAITERYPEGEIVEEIVKEDREKKRLEDEDRCKSDGYLLGLLFEMPIPDLTCVEAQLGGYAKAQELLNVCGKGARGFGDDKGEQDDDYLSKYLLRDWDLPDKD